MSPKPVARGLRTKKRRSNLADLEERLELFVENVKDYAIFMLDPAGRAITWNAGVQRVLGYSEEEFIGIEFHALFRAGEQDAAEQEMQTAAQTGRSDDERWHVRKDGTELWVSGVLTALRDPDGRVRGYAKVMRDTTFQKQVQTQREHLLRREQEVRAEAERANRLKDEFLAIASHELRTPLNAILGWARMLSSGQLDPSRAARAAAIIERNAETQARLVADLLDVSRIITGKLQIEIGAVDVSDVVHAAVESVHHDAEQKHIRVAVSGDTNLTPIEGDASRLQQVIGNLLSNAIRFTPPGGDVWVDVHRRDDHVELMVRDSGQGIPADALPKIFDRFHQAPGTRRSTGGLGLGLAIVRHIVDAHGGTVDAHSAEEGQGATFTVRLPLGLGHASLHERAAAPPPLDTDCAAEVNGLCALVVEDRSDARELVEWMLQRCGMNVIAVDFLPAALAAIDNHRVDVIVSDIGLERDDDGLTLIRSVRARPADKGGLTPAIAVTAYASPDDRTRVLAAGYQMHVSKPIEPSALIAAIATVVRRA